MINPSRLKVEKAEKYRFLSIHYDQEILGWIQSCKAQVSNITNLSIGLTQYEEVILSLYGRKKDKLMKLKNYIEENKDNELEVLRDLRKVNQEYTSLREDYIQEVLHESADLIRKKIPAGWKVELKKLEEVYSRGNEKTALAITQTELEKPALAFKFMFDYQDYQDPLYAIYRANNTVDLTWLKDNDDMIGELAKIEQKLNHSSFPWWPAHGYYYHGDMFEFVIGEGGVNKAANTIVEKFWGMFESYKEFVEKCNKEYLSRAEQG